MNEARASDIIRRNNGLQKLIKNFNQHNSRFQPTVGNLITKVVNTGKRSLDVRSLFTLTQNLGIPALQGLQDLAIKALLELSENKEEEQKNNKTATLRHVDGEFENFIPHLIEMCKNQQKYPSDYLRHTALQILANLSLRDFLRPQFYSHGGLEFFIEVVQKKHHYLANVEAQRAAAKGLVNLVASRKDIRLQVIADLSEEIKLIYRNQIDPVVATFIQTLLHTKDA